MSLASIAALHRADAAVDVAQLAHFRRTHRLCLSAFPARPPRHRPFCVAASSLSKSSRICVATVRPGRGPPARPDNCRCIAAAAVPAAFPRALDVVFRFGQLLVLALVGQRLLLDRLLLGYRRSAVLENLDVGSPSAICPDWPRLIMASQVSHLRSAAPVTGACWSPADPADGRYSAVWNACSLISMSSSSFLACVHLVLQELGGLIRRRRPVPDALVDETAHQVLHHLLRLIPVLVGKRHLEGRHPAVLGVPVDGRHRRDLDLVASSPRPRSSIGCCARCFG